MTIPDKILKKWKVLYSSGDFSKLAEKVEDGYPIMFSRAMKDGKCNEKVFTTMAEFYEEREKLVKEYL